MGTYETFIAMMKITTIEKMAMIIVAIMMIKMKRGDKILGKREWFNSKHILILF